MRQFCGQGLPFGVLDESAFGQCRDQFVNRKIFNFGEEVGEILLLQLRRQAPYDTRLWAA